MLELCPRPKLLRDEIAFRSCVPDTSCITSSASFARLRLSNQPAALDLAALFVHLRSFPPFPLCSIAGAVDGDGGVGWNGSGADCSTSNARLGVSMPGVLSTEVFVLFRLKGVGAFGGVRHSFYLFFWCSSSCFVFVGNPFGLYTISITALSCGQPRGISLAVSLLLASDFLGFRCSS